MYQALYRKYRPLLFEDVVGQKSIVRVLKNSIISNHVAHAYMFFGPRGTGKTSLAKIFARTINCEQNTTGEICQNCNSCNLMLKSDSIDIIEIDAASNNGVDEIRELKSKINLVPNQLKYKIYIIDEVHMLSIGAFNALLKTLEEPPEHAIFVLATTDPQKVPDTIKSRCQCFNFKRISDLYIVDRLRFICDQEEIEVDDKILKHIAIASNGGMRDSLSSLDMLYSSCGKKITMQDYIEINDLVDDEEISLLLEEILSGNIDVFLNHIETLNNCGKNIIQVCEMLLQYGHNLIIDFYKNNNKLSFDYTLLEKFLFLLNEKLFEVRRASNSKIFIEVLVLKFINENILSPQIISREIKIEQKFDKLQNDAKDVNVEKKPVVDTSNHNPVVIEEEKVSIDKKESFDNDDSYDKIESDFLEKYHEIMNIRVNNALSKANKEILIQIKEKMPLLNEYVFDQEIGYLVCALLDGTLRVASDEIVVISLEYDSMIDTNLKNMEKLSNIFHKITGVEQKLAFITDTVWNSKKQEYIAKLQNGEGYEYLDEPALPVMKSFKKRDPLLDHAEKLFGDIVEEE